MKKTRINTQTLLSYFNNIRLNWWLSPNVLIYRVQISSLSSILHRLFIILFFVSLFFCLTTYYFFDFQYSSIISYTNVFCFWAYNLLFVLVHYFVFLLCTMYAIYLIHVLSSSYYITTLKQFFEYICIHISFIFYIVKAKIISIITLSTTTSISNASIFSPFYIKSHYVSVLNQLLKTNTLLAVFPEGDALHNCFFCLLIKSWIKIGIHFILQVYVQFFYKIILTIFLYYLFFVIYFLLLFI